MLEYLQKANITNHLKIDRPRRTFVRFWTSLTTMLIYFNYAHAQMATGSLFKEMRSINPATVSQRPAATFSMVAAMDESKKEQDTSKLYGPGYTASTDGKISSYKAFYGGKNGGILTSEINFDISTGTYEVSDQFPKLNSGGSGVDSQVKSEFDTMFYQVSLGIGNFLGLSIAKFSMNSESTGSTTLDSQSSGVSTVSSAGTTAIDMQKVRLGLRGSLGLDFGLYYDLVNDKETTSTSTQQTIDGSGNGKVTTKQNKVGLGIGITSKTFHIETFYEKQLENIVTQGDDPKTYSPVRYGATIEFIFGGLSIGYTGIFYTQGFTEMDKELTTHVLYPGTLYEDRLENIFNFSLGGSKGHSFGGSAFYSKISAEKKYDNSGTDTLFPTTVTAKGASLNYSYAF